MLPVWARRLYEDVFHPRAMYGHTSSRLIVFATAFLSSCCSSCAPLVAAITSNEVLGDVLACFLCVLVWCVTIAAHLVLVCCILLPVGDQLPDHIFSWVSVGPAGLRRTPFRVQTSIGSSRRRRCLRGVCFLTCFSQGHHTNGYHIIDTVHVRHLFLVAYFHDREWSALLQL